jgi:succinylarginine dihydrolase
MTEEEMAVLRGRVVLDDAMIGELERWVRRHYRTELTLDDLADPQLAMESHAALAELYGLLELGDAPV